MFALKEIYLVKITKIFQLIKIELKNMNNAEYYSVIVQKLLNAGYRLYKAIR